MKTAKLYMLLLLALISCSASAMELAPDHEKSASHQNSELIIKVADEFDDIYEDILTLMSKAGNFNIKPINTLKAGQRLAGLINLPESHATLKNLLIIFIEAVDKLDAESSNWANILELFKPVKGAYNAIRAELHKIAPTIKASPSASVAQLSQEAQLLKDLAVALREDIEKIKTVNENGQKVPGSLQLATSKAFRPHLPESFADLNECLNTYIKFSSLFDNAHDSQYMDFLIQAINNLSEKITIYQYQKNQPKSKLVHDSKIKPILVTGSHRKPKRNIRFKDPISETQLPAIKKIHSKAYLSAGTIIPNLALVAAAKKAELPGQSMEEKQKTVASALQTVKSAPGILQNRQLLLAGAGLGLVGAVAAYVYHDPSIAPRVASHANFGHDAYQWVIKKATNLFE